MSHRLPFTFQTPNRHPLQFNPSPLTFSYLQEEIALTSTQPSQLRETPTIQLPHTPPLPRLCVFMLTSHQFPRLRFSSLVRLRHFKIRVRCNLQTRSWW
ncbi:unnamed protein product [Microthlaspi erraticum]|uniref:Uncharacterized protein n=1 Tax=Microthlaspi erraticum TaxID=1685480 RepID=A0A6D2ITR8_9BRAS|nr:unnamed protein product [Microthlaspi erraticum]